jgi:hypothetical protein
MSLLRFDSRPNKATVIYRARRRTTSVFGPTIRTRKSAAFYMLIFFYNILHANLTRNKQVMIYESHCSSFLNRYGQKQRGFQISPVGITNSHLYSELGVFDCLHLRSAERKRIVWGKKPSGWLLSGCSLLSGNI